MSERAIEIIRNGRQVTVKWTEIESKAGESMAITFQNERDLMAFIDVFKKAELILLGKL